MRETGAKRMLEELRAELQSDLATLQAISSLRADLERIRPFAEDLERDSAALSSGLVVCLIGSTGAGKSSLVNALAGARIAREGVDRPTTVEPTIYAPEDLDPGTLPPIAARVVRYRVNPDSPWAGQVFIDAPDVNSASTDHRAVAAQLAQAADVLMVVMHHQSVVESSPVELLDGFEGRRHLVFVLGRADELSADSLTRLRLQVETLIRTRWGLDEAPLFAVSATTAQTHPTRGEFPALLDHLRSFAQVAVASRLRRSGAIGAASRLTEAMTAIDARVRPEIEEMHSELGAIRDRLRGRFSELVDSRLSQHRRDLELLLQGELALSWSGPGGTAMRAATIAGAGTALAALLLRRNPFLAAGSALGARTLERAGSALRETRLERSTELQGLAEIMHNWLYQDQIALQRRAERLGLDIPSPEDTVIPAIRRAIEDRWQEAVDREWPRAALRSVPATLRRLLDLPLYVFGIWVLGRVGYGFFTDSYAGTDLLLSALILAAVWLWLERRIALWRIRRAARDALHDLRGRLLAELDKAFEIAGSHQDRQTKPLLDALERQKSAFDIWSRWLGPRG